MRERKVRREGIAKAVALIFVCLLTIVSAPMAEARHIPKLDLNEDGKVDVADLQIAIRNFRKRCDDPRFRKLVEDVRRHDGRGRLRHFLSRLCPESTPPVVTITAPADGATVTAGSLLVRGTIQSEEADVGVVVMGTAQTEGAELGEFIFVVTAAVHGNSFAASYPITSETAALTAIVTTASGDIARDTIAVKVTAGPEAPVVFRASPQSGVAPLTVTLSLLAGPVPTKVELDLEGDGLVDITDSRLDNQRFTYNQPGLYFPMVTVTDAQGNSFTARTIVQVYDQAAFDALLQGKWSGMRDALHDGDIDGALRFIDVDAREEFRADFTALAPFLPQIGQELEDIRFIGIRGNRAEYELLSQENGETFSYYVEFILDDDGIWRLAFF